MLDKQPETESERMNHRTEPTVSILVPTLNEADNIDPILSRILSTIELNGLDAEVLFVDGGSSDETRARVERWLGDQPVRLIKSDAKRGLAGDIIAGAKMARGKVVVVLDADLSHPPETIPQLVQPLLDGTHDMALASRYVRGGSMLDWPWTRRNRAGFSAGEREGPAIRLFRGAARVIAAVGE
jgi:dolichol-phosphate mannosyltransferase